MKNTFVNKVMRLLIYVLCVTFALEPYNVWSYPLTNSLTINLLQHKQEISGHILDGNGIPVFGVNVLIKGTQQGTYTKEDGAFSIVADPSDVLVISYLGFKTLEIEVGLKKQFTITLEDDITALDVVNINAGYYAVSEKERTGNIARITASEIEDQPVTEVLATMQGRMPGVYVTQTSGVPGGSFDIQIRGQNSLRTNGNDPLYIIDGVPYSSQTVGDNKTGNAIPFELSPLNSIDPSTIESIEVLKDADATAIYGSRGANGVVLITTKKGKAGKTSFSLEYNFGTGRVPRFLDLMDTESYIAMRKEAFANDGISSYPANAYDVNGTWDQNAYTDWQKELIGGTSEFTDIKGAVSGGNEQTQFNISGSYHKETTVYPGDYAYFKSGFLSSLNHTTKNGKFNIQFSSKYTIQNNNLPGNSFVSKIYELAPNAPKLYNSDGSLNWENSTWVNPLNVLETDYKSNSNDLIANTVISYKMLPSLELKANLGYSNTKFNNQYILPYTFYDPAYNLTSQYSSIYKNDNYRYSWIAEPQISYSRKLKQLTIKALMGATFQEQSFSKLVLGGSGFSNNAFVENLAAASIKSIYEDSASEYRYNAVFGRLNFNIKNRYILNLTGRRDGSSRFGSGKQFANFGAVGAGWLFSEEGWMKEHLGVLSFGKLRGSYGITGSDQLGDYQYEDTYSLNGNTYGTVATLEPSRLYNPDFSWEESQKLEFGLEMGLLNDRFFLTTAWYRNRFSNQLVGIPLSSVTGFQSIQANLDATVENSGWEFFLRSQNFNVGAFRWSTTFNFSINKNELLSFPDLESSTYANSYVIGESLNIVKLYQYQGVDPDIGNYQFKDVNGDGNISFSEDRNIIKSTDPAFFGGLQNSISYKGFTLDFLFQFVKQENYSAFYGMATPGAMRNNLMEVTNRWQNSGDNAEYQAYTTGANTTLNISQFNYTQSDAVFEDVSFIRLKNIFLSYTLPKDFLNGIDCSFILRGQNLLTFTSYEGFDPESVYNNKIPALRIITTGVQLKF
ncbi:SusC/RagA family TonB-linked outer membrane protein [Formosa sp. 3Alg 14/1]|uniref:SusC/RagA family TonB-linked outer membrane protein n=1 Tax=Formosa sp. 3Alg 14/1 TaxID=3382190 RepID=UPI0039BDA7AA